MKSQIICIVGIPYSFTDNSGKLCEGVTKKAAVIHFNEDGSCRSLEVVKCTKDFEAPLKKDGEIYFDGYGRLSKFVPLQG